MTQSCIIDNSLLDAVSKAAAESPRGRKNHNFHRADTEICHRLLNAIEPGSYIQPHRHADVTKDEAIVILRGRLGAVIFNDDGTIREKVVLQPGGPAVAIDVPHGTFHTLVALERGTVFFEAKAGPYQPLESHERAPWAPPEGHPHAGEYLSALLALFS